MRTYSNEEIAGTMMRLRNRASKLAHNYRDIIVMVDGPGDGEFSLMDLKEAVENCFTYRIEY